MSAMTRRGTTAGINWQKCALFFRKISEFLKSFDLKHSRSNEVTSKSFNLLSFVWQLKTENEANNQVTLKMGLFNQPGSYQAKFNEFNVYNSVMSRLVDHSIYLIIHKLCHCPNITRLGMKAMQSLKNPYQIHITFEIFGAIFL